jgi:hypothetical protein
MYTIRTKLSTTLTIRRLAVVVTAVCATVFALVAVPIVSASSGQAGGEVFYTTSDSSSGAEVFSISVQDSTIAVRDVGPTRGGDCISLALSGAGKLYSMCGSLFGTQQLATLDLKTGQANLFGAQVSGLAVMALGFGRNGVLYAVGNCNPDPTTSECTPGSPNFNTLYTVDVATGAFTRVGQTGAHEFFMDLAAAPDGSMLGVTSTVKPSTVPAKLYRLSLATGQATEIGNLVGSNSIMGLAFGRDGRLFATDFNTTNSGLYTIDPRTRFETAIDGLPFGFSSALELVDSD